MECACDNCRAAERGRLPREQPRVDCQCGWVQLVSSGIADRGTRSRTALLSEGHLERNSLIAVCLIHECGSRSCAGADSAAGRASRWPSCAQSGRETLTGPPGSRAVGGLCGIRWLELPALPPLAWAMVNIGLEVRTIFLLEDRHASTRPTARGRARVAFKIRDD